MPEILDEDNIGGYHCVYFDQDRYWGLLLKVILHYVLYSSKGTFKSKHEVSGYSVMILKLNKLFILPWVFSDDEGTAVNKAEFKFLRYVTRWALEISPKSCC